MNQFAFENALYDGSEAFKMIFTQRFLTKLQGVKLKGSFSICGQFV